MSQSPQLLIQWSSPWQEFLSSMGPALRPSPPRMHMEAQAGLFPARGLLLAFLLEAAALAAMIARPIAVERPDPAHAPEAHDVIYFTADELPRTEDFAGGRSGRHGASGGASLQHPTQTIKVARGEKLDSRVVDAPSLNLPQSESQVSNLLAYKATVPTVPPSPIVVHADQRRVEQPTKAPHLTLPSDTMPSLPDARVSPIAPPSSIKVASERAKTEQPAAIDAPKVQIAREQMPELPQANVVVKAPPVPIRVTQTNHKAALEVQTPSAPRVAMGQEQMPSLPEAAVAVKAPPTPIQVARSQRRASAASVAAPKINTLGSRSGEQLAGVLSAPVGAPVAPPAPAAPADSKTAGVIVSTHPGTQAARPKDEQKTLVAMDRTGADVPGSGSNGGGTGMRPGKGTGSSATGTNAGAPAVGTGQGADLYARNGNSPNLGPGGTGNMTSGTPRAPGISVSGGKNSITLPSFGGPPSPQQAGHSDVSKNMGTGITVIASPRAGGALNLYGALKGDRVYTIYINTRLGTAIMQFADPNSVGREYPTALTSPRVLYAAVPGPSPTNGHVPRVLIRCDLDEEGVVKNPRILQSENADFASKVLASLPSWKFTPAFRGNQAVAVNAIVGFGVDTN